MKYFEMVPVKKRGLFWSFVRYFRYGLSQMSLIKEDNTAMSAIYPSISSMLFPSTQ